MGSREVCGCGRELEHGSCPQPDCGGRRPDPKPGEVWRERRREYAGRTVKVLDIRSTGGHGQVVLIQSLTNDHGQPMTRAPKTRVKLANWHKIFEFDREEP